MQSRGKKRKETARLYATGLVVVLLIVHLTSCIGQTNSGNELAVKEHSLAHEREDFTYYGIRRSPSPTDTSAGWNQNGKKILLTGTVYQRDGRTPASGVMLYYYHTNMAGQYVHQPNEIRSMPPNELGHTHGYIRGWIKTDSTGKYFIYTVRPGAYPTHDEPAHIHMTVKEPNAFGEYYIDDFVFDNDRLLTSSRRNKMENRCGSGVLRMVQSGDLWVGERNLILGLNIPGYPERLSTQTEEGIDVGEDIHSFTPYHAWGPDKGTRTCPICKYGWYHGMLYFVGNRPHWSEIEQWLKFLEAESRKRADYLKVYFVYGNEKGYSTIDRELELARLGKKLKLERVALTFVPSFSDEESEIYLNRIGQNVENTFVLYKRSRVIGKFVNLSPTEDNFNHIRSEFDKTINEYFHMSKPEH